MGCRAAALVVAAAAIGLAAGAPVADADLGLPTQVSQGLTGGNGAVDVTGFPGMTANASRVFFSTAEPLVAGDTDTKVDVYERSGGTTALVSVGPNGGNGPFDVAFSEFTETGDHAFFETQESLVATDTDTASDIYDRSGGTTTLVSVGAISGSGNANVDSALLYVSPDGTRVVFATDEPLASTDTDMHGDLYLRTGGTTVQISTGPTDANIASTPTVPVGASADGTKLFFQTRENLTSTDMDTVDDVYEWSAGAATLVTPGPYPEPISGAAVSDDGSKVLVLGTLAGDSNDTDGAEDVYVFSGGTPTLVSKGPAGQGNGGQPAAALGLSADGAHAFFTTTEKMVDADMDTAKDIYERTGGVTTLVSTGPADGNGPFDTDNAIVSADGTSVFFITAEKLVAADTDPDRADLYERSGGVTTLLSTGPAGGNGPFAAGNFFFPPRGQIGAIFTTSEQLVSEDTDSARDIYERAGTTTRLVSRGETGGNGALDASIGGSSGDGSHFLFTTRERLACSDGDAASDLYVAAVGAGPARDANCDGVPDDAAPGPGPSPTPFPSPTPLPEPTPEPPKPSCADKAAPVTHLKVKRTGKAVVLSGTSKDAAGKCPSGIKFVQVSLARVKGRTGVNCRFVKSATRYTITPEQNCRKPVLFKAKGTKKWSFTFKLRLPRGAYRAQARGTDKSGNKETPRTGRKFFTV